MAACQDRIHTHESQPRTWLASSDVTGQSSLEDCDAAALRSLVLASALGTARLGAQQSLHACQREHGARLATLLPMIRRPATDQYCAWLLQGKSGQGGRQSCSENWNRRRPPSSRGASWPQPRRLMWKWSAGAVLRKQRRHQHWTRPVVACGAGLRRTTLCWQRSTRWRTRRLSRRWS